MKYTSYWNKYIKGLKCNREDIDITKWSKNNDIKKIQKRTGLDFRECYSLDMSIAMYLYSRLSLYKDYTIVDLEQTECEFENHKSTLRECINFVLKGLKFYIEDDKFIPSDKRLKKYIEYLELSEEEIINIESKCDVIYLVYTKALRVLSYIAPLLWD